MIVSSTELCLQRVERSRQHHVEPRLQPALIDQPLVRRHFANRRARVVHHRQAEASRFGVGKQDLLVELRRRGVGPDHDETATTHRYRPSYK